MMFSVLSVVVSLVVSAGPAEAPVSLPSSPPPQFGVAVIDEKGNLSVGYVIVKPVDEARERTIHDPL